ncbi:hypothetical protein Mapa_008957 [Marchantia paleacea]|nr:hypothetical protein Mapa_008957 [Marchantia paleacea]
MATVRSTMLAIILVAGLMAGASATSFTVGDTTGWTIVSRPTFYQEWADAQTFKVGDDITFTYTTGHNVYEVSSADFASCSTSEQAVGYTVANPNIKLTKAGEFFFICEVPGHCDLGMKMSLTVGGNGTSSPSKAPAAKSPSATPSASPPVPAPSAASGLQSSAAMIVGSLLAVGAVVW